MPLSEMTAIDPQAFVHVRIVVGVVTGLSVTRLLSGLSRFVQHPELNQIYLPHLVWTAFLILFVIHFWWFEFALFRVEHWEFEEYFFVLGYAALIFFTSALLFPDHMGEYLGFADYFHSRQRWFYALLGTIFIMDVLDSMMKGMEHFRALGVIYPFRQIGLCGLCIVAACVKHRMFHLCFAIVALIAEVWWIFSAFRFID
ncbi:hypothetical protein [Pseudomonas sp. EL_65y_Pfl2_R95]|uniref:hypothetical protein n=1 Tax=Pseudomonas sp. EL_65y_Pfl2_R95 TaxID=3088698 RepID=UPI0030D921E7